MNTPALDMIDIVDNQVLMHYLAEEECGPRQEKIDGRFLTDFMFHRHFRFSKHGFEELLKMVAPILTHPTRRGGGLDPAIQLQAGLNHLAGRQFQRTTGLTYGASQNNARECLIRVVDAIITLKDHYIYMPNAREKKETSDFCFAKKGLRGFAWGIDGTHCFFVKEPKGLPANVDSQRFYSRKQRYSINVQVVGNENRICDIDCRWPGGTHDSNIYHFSEARQHMESQITYKCAGDSGYAISQIMVKPYTTAEALNDNRKALFNHKLSSIRTIMTENIFGRWKQRFPILRNLSTHLVLSQKIILATAILHNIATLWNEEIPDGDLDDDQLEEPNEEELRTVVNYEVSVNQTRRIGQVERDLMLQRDIP